MAGEDLFSIAWDVIQCRDPEEKVQRTAEAVRRWRKGKLGLPDPAAPPRPIDAPGRPTRPRLVHPRALPRRDMGSEAGFAAFLHALAHIEFNAINLAWDAVYRFRGLPIEYYHDWVKVAEEEAIHFNLLKKHLESLGYKYGDFDAHDGLWQAALETADDPLLRMAIVPRGLEARGLDAGPRLLEKIRARGDQEALAIMTRIVAEEEGHVAVGSRWFRHLCRERGLDPLQTFVRIHTRQAHARPKPPFNREARLRAGFEEEELRWLEGAND